jgi:hypothetical protein
MEHVKWHIGLKFQTDPRYIKIMHQLDPVFIARYLGEQEIRNYRVDDAFKHTALKFISKDIVASLVYSAISFERNTLIEPVLLRMSDDDWQDLAKSSSQLKHHSIARRLGLATYYKTAWQYYLRCLTSQGVRSAILNARAEGFDVT